MLISENVRPEEIRVANGMATVMRGIGGVIGGQLGAALLAAHTISGTDVPSVTGYQLTFAIVGVVGLAGAAVAAFIPQPRRADATRELEALRDAPATST